MSSYPPSAATDPNLPHDSLVPHILGICSAMLIVVTLVVAARFWIRLTLVQGRLGADDWCILAAWALAVAFDLDPINQTKYGLGRHIYDLEPDVQFYKSLELYYFGEMLYYVCVALTKVAILFLYLRLAVQKGFRRIVWGVVIFVIATAVTFVIVTIFQCTPIHKAWDVTGKVQGTCIDVNAVFYANAGLDIFQDALIYVLPLRMLYQLQVPRRQKVALMGLFTVGGFVVITGMVRLNFLKVAQNTSDPPYDNYGGAVWSSIESNIGVVCASLPTFKVFIDRLFPNLLNPTRGSGKENPSYPSSSKKQRYIRGSSLDDVELGAAPSHGDLSKDDDTFRNERNHKYSISAWGEPPIRMNDGDERPRESDAQDHGNDIWKSMTVTVTHGQP